MSPLEEIKYGIINSDWNSIILGYSNLTGEHVVPTTTDKPKAKKGRPKKVIVEETFEVRKTIAEPEPKFKNLFVDDGTEHADMITENKLWYDNYKPQDTKRKAVKVIAKCKKCKREFDGRVEPFTCGKCLRAARNSDTPIGGEETDD